jgi:hypothetical protein
MVAIWIFTFDFSLIGPVLRQDHQFAAGNPGTRGLNSCIKVLTVTVKDAVCVHLNVVSICFDSINPTTSMISFCKNTFMILISISPSFMYQGNSEHKCRLGCRLMFIFVFGIHLFRFINLTVSERFVFINPGVWLISFHTDICLWLGV